MTVATGCIFLDQTYSFFHREEHNDTGQDPEAYAHVVTVFMHTILVMVMMLTVAVIVPVAMVVLGVAVGLYCVWDQV